MGLLLFRNEACMVINKLPGESSEFPDLNFPLDSEGPKGTSQIFPVHRLDVPVSGCLLLALSKTAAAFLGEAFRAGSRGQSGESSVEKRYWAIVEKTTRQIPQEAELVHWLSVNKKTNKTFAHETRKDGYSKKAVLRYRFCGQGDNYLFLEIDPVTGRHHQIRAQLAAIGLYVKGDLKYGAKRSEKAGGSIRLHAHSLAFPNPLNHRERIRVESLPPFMDPLWQAFVDTVRPA